MGSDMLASNFGICRDAHFSASARAQRDADRREPVVPVRPRTGEDGEEFFLQRLGDGARAKPCQP